MSDERVYYQVTPGSDVHEFCSDWRQRQIEIGERLTAWANSKGGTGWVPGFDGSLVSVIFGGADAPAGWRKAKYKSADGYPQHTPAVRTVEGKALREEIAALERLPRHDEFLTAFDIPRAVDVHGDQSRRTWSLRPGGWSICDVGWIGETFWIVLPDIDAFKAKVAKEGLTMDPADIRLPEALVRSSRARYELAIAQHKVDEEERIAA